MTKEAIVLPSHNTEFVNENVESIFIHRKGLHQSNLLQFYCSFCLIEKYYYPGLAAQIQ